jgi:hypothetical protein
VSAIRETTNLFGDGTPEGLLFCCSLNLIFQRAAYGWVGNVTGVHLTLGSSQLSQVLKTSFGKLIRRS